MHAGAGRARCGAGEGAVCASCTQHACHLHGVVPPTPPRSGAPPHASAGTTARRSVLLAAPVLLAPLLGLDLSPETSGTGVSVSGAAAVAAEGQALLDTVTPMDALRDKDYGKARMK